MNDTKTQTGYQAVGKVLEALVENKAWKATAYLSEKFVVNMTRKLYNGKFPNNTELDIVLTIGRPNYLQREFIKDCKKAGEPFPVKKVQLKFPPKK
jgi:hypothetical protein